MVDGSFLLLVKNSSNMAHYDAARVEPSTPSDEVELVSARTVRLSVMPHIDRATQQEQRLGFF
jgi:hypothetical protein